MSFSSFLPSSLTGAPVAAMAPVTAFNTRLQSANPAVGPAPGIVEQIMIGLAGAILVYLFFIFTEVVYAYLKRLGMDRTVLLPYTYTMDAKSMIIQQDPNVATSQPVSLSRNERTGTEFSYAFYLNVHPNTFQETEGLLHVFHKGYASQFPLLAPGVYLRSETNTMRVYMNTYKTWNNYVEVENFPVGKWVHVVIACKENALEVYVNGNLSKKLSFEGFAPYQNYQDIHCFSGRVVSINQASGASSVTGVSHMVKGVAKGMLSRLTYFSYALSFAEIQTLMNEGPSKEMDSQTMMDVPPYLTDSWWSKA